MLDLTSTLTHSFIAHKDTLTTLATIILSEKHLLTSSMD